MQLQAIAAWEERKFETWMLHQCKEGCALGQSATSWGVTFGYAEPKERVTVVLQVRVYTKGSSDYGVKEGLRSTRGVLRGGDLPFGNY